MRKLLLPSLFLLTLVGIPAVAHADPISDCVAGCAEFNGGAIFVTGSIQTSGTGVIEPFVRLQANGQDTDEDGHNTDAKKPVNDEKTGTWTHSVAVADLDNIVKILGQNYYEFILDLGEPADLDQNLLSLDALKICTSDDPEETEVGNCPTVPITFDLDAGMDRTVLLNYNLFGGGNGKSDLFVYIPASALADANEFFYMYSAFGYTDGYHADGSFEEWSYRHHVGVTPLCPFPADQCDEEVSEVPEPTSLLLMGSGLALAGKIRSRRKKR